MKINMNATVTAKLNTLGADLFQQYIKQESSKLRVSISEMQACYNYVSETRTLTCQMFQLLQMFQTDEVVFEMNSVDVNVKKLSAPEPNTGNQLVKFTNSYQPRVAFLSLLPGDEHPVWISNEQEVHDSVEWVISYEDTHK